VPLSRDMMSAAKYFKPLAACEAKTFLIDSLASTLLRLSTDSRFQMAPQTSPARVIYPFNPHTKTANNLPKMGFFLHEDPDNTPLPIRSFVVDDHHPIVPRWRDVARQIMDKLDQAGLKWVAVECFQRRQLTQKSSTHDDTSVVITVQELTLETDHLQPLLHEIHVLSGMFPTLSLCIKVNGTNLDHHYRLSVR